MEGEGGKEGLRQSGKTVLRGERGRKGGMGERRIGRREGRSEGERWEGGVRKGEREEREAGKTREG